MLVKALKSEQLEKYRQTLVHFTLRYGEHRITQKAIQCLQDMPPDQLSISGNLILIVLEDQAIVGLSFTSSYGKEVSFIVTHPHYRGMQIGQKLVSEQMNQLGKFTCKVAADNIASLKMCFRAGLHAVELFEGPTGKPTLRFENY